MKNYLKRLNWSGFAITLVIVMLASLTNPNVNSFLSWVAIVVFIGIPLSLFPLFVGIKENPRKEEKKKGDGYGG